MADALEEARLEMSRTKLFLGGTLGKKEGGRWFFGWESW